MSPETNSEQPAQPTQQPYIPKEGMTENAMNNAKKPKKGMMMAVVGLIVAALVAVVVFFLLGSSTDAQSDMDKAMKRVLSMDDISANITVDADGQQFQIAIKSAGEDAAEISMKLDIPNGLTTTQIEVNAVAMGDQLYLNVNGLEAILAGLIAGGEDELADLGLTPADLQGIDGEWVLLDEEGLEGLAGFATGLTGISDLELAEAEQAEEEAEEDLNKLLELYDENPVFLVDENLGEESVNGQDATKYSVKVNSEEAIEDFLKEFNKVTSENTVSGTALSLVEIEELANDYADQSVEGLSVWLAGDELVRLEFADSEGKLSADFNDEPVNVTAPEGAVSFEDSGLGKMITAIFGAALQGASEFELAPGDLDFDSSGEFEFDLDSSDSEFGSIQGRARDTERQSDLWAIYGQLEIYYTDNGFYPLSDDLDVLLSEGLEAGALIAPLPGEEYLYNPTGCDSLGCSSYTLSVQAEEKDLNLDGKVDSSDVFSEESLN